MSSENIPFLSTVKPGAFENRAAICLIAVSCFVFVVTIPFAKVQMAQVSAFIPIYESALILCDLITAAFLFSQFKVIRTQGLLVIATAYVFSAFLAMAHLVSFPGLFFETGAFGSGPQTTAWLYMLWHAGFPAIVIYYIGLGPKIDRLHDDRKTTSHVFVCVAVSALCALASFFLLTAGHEYFPTIMRGDNYTPAMKFVVGSVWLLTLTALFLLWRKKDHTILELCLTVVLIAWIFDVGLAAVFNHGRYDVGFYAGRLYGLFANVIVLIFFIFENFSLYRELAESLRRERLERAVVAEKTVQLIALNGDLEDFSYSVSHDLKGPLRRVSSYAGFLADDHAASLNDDAKKLISSIVGNTKTMIQLIDGLLAFSRLGRQKIDSQAFIIERMANDVFAELAPPDRKIEFSCKDVSTAWGDPALLRQVLCNLIGNAVKFTRDANPAVIEFGSFGHNEQSVFYVKDNGTGFDMKYADRLFGVFKRLHASTEFEGNGVGLAIAKKIVDRHGGRIWAEAAEGQGATFYFSLGSDLSRIKT